VSTRPVAGLAAAVLAVAGCGGGQGDDQSAVRSTVQRYLAAVARGDAAGACAQLTDRSRQELADVGAQLRLAVRSCEATLTRAFNSPSGPSMRRLGHLRIARVTVKGDHAVAAFSGGGRPILLVHDGGAWRIESTPAGERD
jgi:ketosteroid isomerase-like protein